MAFTVKQFDRRPLLVGILSDEDGVVNLTTAGSVFFNMRESGGGAVKVTRGSTAITSAAAGEVTYTWGTADLDTAGDYEGEFEVVWNDGKAETFPSADYIEITVIDDIA
jgi:hypothetical protein